LETQLASKMEDVAAYAENLRLKDEVVQSLNAQLAELQAVSPPLSTSSSPHMLVETSSCHLEKLAVFCQLMNQSYFLRGLMPKFH